MSEPPRQTLRQRFREETSREILASAEETFAEQGLEGASMAQIAARAGVAVGTLYNRFKDREALLEALLGERRAELLHELDRRLGELERAPIAERLEGFFFTLFSHFDEHGPFLRLVFTSDTGSDAKRARTARALFERLEALLNHADATHVLRPDPDHAFAPLLMAAARGMLQRDYYGLTPLAPSAASKTLVELFLNGARR